jgi:hypothetical protein
MKRGMKDLGLKLIHSLIFMFICFVSVAQPGDPCPNPPCDPDVPITGIEVLVGMGALLGAKKIIDARKKKT